MSKHLLLFILILAVCTNVFAQQTKSIRVWYTTVIPERL